MPRRGPDDRRDARGPGGPAAGVTSSDRVAAAVEELYGAGPEAFTGRRGELAAAARTAGDRDAAKAITALRRPTRAAWVVNRLARTDPSAPAKVAELAAALRAAQEAKHGPRLRELSAARGALTDVLTAQALTAAGIPDPPPSLRLEVAQTLTAAFADPEVAAAFASGTLTHAAQWSGFGVLPADAGLGEAAGSASLASERPASPARDAGGTGGTEERAIGGARGARAGAGATPARPAVAPRPRAAEDRLARETAERAARHRERHEEAERTVAAAAAAAAEAASAEDNLEARVRDLEQRLTQARADLATARMRARHAEAAERRARQALAQAGGPDT